MSQQRMAGSQGFKQGMNRAARPKGESDNYKTGGSHLMGSASYDRQMGRESRSQQQQAAASTQSNIGAYINVSNSANQSNGNFASDVANKYTSQAREQSSESLSRDKGYADRRMQSNSNFANQAQEKAFNKDRGFGENQSYNNSQFAKSEARDADKRNEGFSGQRRQDNTQYAASQAESANRANQGFSSQRNTDNANFANSQAQRASDRNQGFSGQQISQGGDYANNQAARAADRNKGFGANTFNKYQGLATKSRESNTDAATRFANNSMNKYITGNRQNQSVNTQQLDQQVRQQPIVDKAYSDVQGLNTYGDLYSYGRGGLPNFTRPAAPKPIETPDFEAIGDKYTDKMDEYKLWLTR